MKITLDHSLVYCSTNRFSTSIVMEVVLGRFERKNKINKVIIQINMSVKAAKERYLMIQELKKITEDFI